MDTSSRKTSLTVNGSDSNNSGPLKRSTEPAFSGKSRQVDASGSSKPRFKGKTTVATPPATVSGTEKERKESNVQTPDFQATLKSIDDEIGYESPTKSV